MFFRMFSFHLKSILIIFKNKSLFIRITLINAISLLTETTKYLINHLQQQQHEK